MMFRCLLNDEKVLCVIYNTYFYQSDRFHNRTFSCVFTGSSFRKESRVRKVSYDNVWVSILIIGNNSIFHKLIISGIWGFNNKVFFLFKQLYNILRWSELCGTGDISNLSAKIRGSKNLWYHPSQFLGLDYMFLLCIHYFEIGSELVISTFNKGKSLIGGSPFLQFCKK